MFSNEIVYTGSVEYVTTYTTSSETVERSNKFDYFVRIASVLTKFDYYIILSSIFSSMYSNVSGFILKYSKKFSG